MSEGIENRSVRRARKKETKEIDIWLLRELQRYCYSLPVLEFCFFRGVAPHIPSIHGILARRVLPIGGDITVTAPRWANTTRGARRARGKRAAAKKP